MRAKYVLSEVMIGLWRNVTMTIAMIITMTVSLTMLGASLVLYHQIDQMKSIFISNVEVSIFLTDTSTPRPSRAPIWRLARSRTPWSSRSSFETTDQAFEKFKKMTARLARTWSRSTTADDLPQSYRVKLKDPNKFDAVQRPSTRALPGVSNDRRPGDPAGQGLQGARRAAEPGAGARHRPGPRGPAAGRQHDPGRRLQQATRSRGDEAGRRVELVHPVAVRARGDVRRHHRCDPRLRWPGLRPRCS